MCHINAIGSRHHGVNLLCSNLERTTKIHFGDDTATQDPVTRMLKNTTIWSQQLDESNNLEESA
jgi:hypothetical protein